jgi:hypothetical protein
MPNHGKGPPTVYRERIASKVLDAIASGATLEAACAEHGMAKGTVAVWAARDYPPGFRERYFAAFAAKILAQTDQILPLVDGVLGNNSMAQVTAARNAADMRRWLASRLLGEFSERIDHQMTLQGSVRIYVPTNGRLEPGDDAKLIEAPPDASGADDESAKD